MFRLIFEGRVACLPTGNTRTYNLPANSGGSTGKAVQYAVAVLDKTNNVRLGLGLDHGPTAELLTPHTASIIALAAPPSTPCVVIGEAGAGMLCEYIRAKVSVEDSTHTGEESATIRVFEMLKPF